MITQNMGLFGKKAKNETKCDVCDLVLPTPERLERHKKKAHGNVPEKKNGRFWWQCRRRWLVVVYPL